MASTRSNQQRSKISMKSKLITAAFAGAMSFMLFTGTAFSQDDQNQQAPPPQGSEMGGHKMGGHHQMPTVDEQLQHLTKKLNLSDDQQTKVKAVLEDQHTKMEALHNDSTTAREDKFGKMRDIRQNSDTQIKAILNEDQQKKFDKIQQEQHDRMMQRQAPPSN